MSSCPVLLTGLWLVVDFSAAAGQELSWRCVTWSLSCVQAPVR